MTVSASNSKNIYDGNDATTVFPYTYKVLDSAHLTVIRTDADDAETTLVLDTDYTMDGVGEASGGNVTYPKTGSPLPTGEKLTLVREVPLLQLTDYHNQGGFYPETTEEQFDLDVMMMQSLQEQLDRCLKTQISSDILPDDLLDEIITARNVAVAAAVAAAASAVAAAASEAAAAVSAAEALASELAAEAAAQEAVASATAVNWFNLGKM